MTLDYILNKYQLDVNQPSPIRLLCSRWKSLGRLYKNLGFKVGVEIGVAGGHFSATLCDYIPGLRLYLVDTWEIYDDYTDTTLKEVMDDNYIKAKKTALKYNCQIIRDYSQNVAKRFADESLDFVFIDANHSYKFVLEDIEAWSKKVRKDGIVSGHDYFHHSDYGVVEAVDEWVAKNNIKPLFVYDKDRDPTWFYVKT